MSVPQLTNGTLVNADHWNANVNLINANETAIAGHETRLDTVEPKVTTLETNQGTRGTNGTVYSEIGTLKTADTNLGNRVTTLEGKKYAGAYCGQWGDINNATGGQRIDTDPGEKITEFTNPLITPVGCSINAGTITVNQAGWWEFVVAAQYTAGTSVRALWLSKSANTSGSGLVKYGALAGPSMDAQSTSAVIKCNAGDAISAYAAIWQGGAAVDIWRAGGNSITCVWLGV